MRCRRHAPDRVADIVGHQERALLVEADADRAALGFALVVEKTGQDVPRLARRRTAQKSPCSRRGFFCTTSRAGQRMRHPSCPAETDRPVLKASPSEAVWAPSA